MRTQRNSPQPPVARVCRMCSKGFSVSAHQARTGGGIYCSRACLTESQRTGEVRACEHCGSSFRAYRYEIEAGGGRFCSPACAGVGRRTPVIERACLECGSAFTFRITQLKARNPRFCSPICRGAYTRRGTVARFWKNVQKTDGCWLWMGKPNADGYGRFHANGRMVPAHAFAWTLANGPVPKGKEVCHHCDNPPCVRNDGANSHLFAGTHAENMEDAKRKGRNPSGDRHWSQRRAV